MSTNVITLPGQGPKHEGPRQFVADNLAAELARKRYSGRQAAKALGVTQMYVARRVSGEVELSVSDLFRFSALLSIDPAVLLREPSSDPTNVGSNLRSTD